MPQFKRGAKVRFKFQLCLIRGILPFFAGNFFSRTLKIVMIFDVLMPPTDSEDTFYSISNHSYTHTHRYGSVGYFMCRKLLRDVDFFSIEFTYSSEYSSCVDCYELDMSILYCYIQSTVTVITTKVRSKFFLSAKKSKKRRKYSSRSLYYF